MITLEEALRKIDEAVTPLPPRNVSPLEAVGCAVAAECVEAEAREPVADFRRLPQAALPWAQRRTAGIAVVVC